MAGRTRDSVLMALAMGLAMLPSVLRAENALDPRPDFLRYLVRFVHWPADALGEEQAPFVLCAATPLMLPWLASMVGTRVDGRQLRLSARPDGRDGLDGCHAVFLDSTAVRRVNEALRARGEPRAVLTVGEGARLRGRGVMVVLEVKDEGALEFDVDLRALQRHGLRMSARMLHMAREVRRP